MGKLIEELKKRRAANNPVTPGAPAKPRNTAASLLAAHRASQGFGPPKGGDDSSGGAPATPAPVSGAPASGGDAPPGGMVPIDEELRRRRGFGIQL